MADTKKELKDESLKIKELNPEEAEFIKILREAKIWEVYTYAADSAFGNNVVCFRLCPGYNPDKIFRLSLLLKKMQIDDEFNNP